MVKWGEQNRKMYGFNLSNRPVYEKPNQEWSVWQQIKSQKVSGNPSCQQYYGL